MDKEMKIATPLKFKKSVQGRKFDDIYIKTINVLNERGGMGNIHREAPYDLKKRDDLINAIENTFCELMDINRYFLSLDKIVNSYDETLEIYEPKEWLHGSSNNLHSMTRDSLNNSSSLLEALLDTKREEFFYLLEKAIRFPGEPIYEFIEKIEKENIEKFLEIINESLWEIDDYYKYATSEQKEEFVKYMVYNVNRFLEIN